MNEFLTNLNTYSNLLLVIITSIYVFLTWRMVSEMRRAREAESEPQLVANLIPLGAMLLKLRISNAGRGPALDIKAIIRLESSKDNAEAVWSHPVLLSNGHEDFRLPGDNNNNYLDKLASNYDKLVVELEWRNSFKNQQNSKYVIDLKQQLDGWTKVKFLLHPDDIPIQLSKIKDELTKINGHFQKQETREIFKDMEEEEMIEKHKLAKKRKKRDSDKSTKV